MSPEQSRRHPDTAPGTRPVLGQRTRQDSNLEEQVREPAISHILGRSYLTLEPGADTVRCPTVLPFRHLGGWRVTRGRRPVGCTPGVHSRTAGTLQLAGISCSPSYLNP